MRKLSPKLVRTWIGSISEFLDTGKQPDLAQAIIQLQRTEKKLMRGFMHVSGTRPRDARYYKKIWDVVLLCEDAVKMQDFSTAKLLVAEAEFVAAEGTPKTKAAGR